MLTIMMLIIAVLFFVATVQALPVSECAYGYYNGPCCAELAAQGLTCPETGSPPGPRTNGGICSQTSDCMTSLKCIEGICKCYTYEYYMSSSLTCETKLSYGGQCTYSSACENNLICTNGVCGCTDSQFFDYTCKAKSSYGGQCSNSTQCEDTMTCRNDVCGCTDFQYFDSTCKPKHAHTEECNPEISNTCSNLDNLCITDTTGKHRCLCDVSDYSRSGECRPLSELQITNFQVQKNSPTQVRFTWTANDYGQQVTYKIEWTSDVVLVNKGEKTAEKDGVLVSDLTPGRQYKFVVISTLSGDSYYAEKLTTVERSVDMLPAQPGPIDQDTSKLDSPPYNLTFQPSEGDVAKYKITLTINGNSTFREVIEVVEPRADSVDLLPGKVYTYTIISFNKKGEFTQPVLGSFTTGLVVEDYDDDGDKINVPLVAGASVASLALVALIIVSIVVVRKKRKADNKKSSKQDAELTQKDTNILYNNMSYASNGYRGSYDKQYKENVYNEAYEEGYRNVSIHMDEDEGNAKYTNEL